MAVATSPAPASALRRSSRKRPSPKNDSPESKARSTKRTKLEDGYESELTPPPTTPPSKRRAPPKRKPKTDLLQDLPLELIFEILSHLPTRDLVHLSTACKAFYTVLIQDEHTALGLWERARAQEFQPVPSPPKDVSEIQWALFIYGSDCQKCGEDRHASKGKLNVTPIFSFGRRLCKSCFKSHLIRGPDHPTAFRQNLPYANTSILEFLTPSDRTLTGLPAFSRVSWTGDVYVQTGYYWRPDITKMSRLVAEKFPAVYFSECTPSEDQEYVTWAAARRTEVQEAIRWSRECCDWYGDMLKHYKEEKAQERAGKAKQRSKNVKARRRPRKSQFEGSSSEEEDEDDTDDEMETVD